MPVSEQERSEAIERVASDLVVTLGWDRRQAVAFAERAGGGASDGWGDGDAGVYALRVAEEVQQRLHDTFVDTTWPGCPLHRHHPLWLEGEGDWPVWRCVAANVSIAPLGGLPATTRS